MTVKFHEISHVEKFSEIFIQWFNENFTQLLDNRCDRFPSVHPMQSSSSSLFLFSGTTCRLICATWTWL